MSPRVVPQVVRNSSHPHRKALVLGNRAIATLIARQLEAEGFQAELQADRYPALPSLADPEATHKLKAILSDYRGEWVHPGANLWAERTELTNIAQELGVDLIGPPNRVLSVFNDKLNLLAKAERIGIPNLVLSFDPISNVREVERILDRRQQKYPLVLKSVRGCGNVGLLVVHEHRDLESKLPLWLDQLRHNLGEAIFFPERYLEGARHIVVPFARFQGGKTQIFPMTDASLQSRYRKIVEIAPPTGVENEMIRQLSEWTRVFAENVDFVGVGALEFLVDSSRAFLVEGLARLNTSFHLWESLAGTSAVSWQLACQERKPVPEISTQQYESGVVLRVYAEDSLLQLPQPGHIHEVGDRREWKLPNSEAELTLAYGANSEVPPEEDGTLGFVWAFGQNRKQTLTLARGALNDVWIAGSVQTNERFISELLTHPWVREGIFHAGFVDEDFVPNVRPTPQLIQAFASICATHPQVPASEAGWRWAVGDQWIKLSSSPVRWSKPPLSWEREGLFGVSGELDLADGRITRVCAFPIAAVAKEGRKGEDRWQVRVGEWTLVVRRISKQERRAALLSLVPGRIHSLLFREGSQVPAHEPLVIVESLKALVPHALPVEVRINRWKIGAEERVQMGQELAEFEILAKN